MSKKIVIGAVGVVAAGVAFFGYSSYSSGKVEEKFKEAFSPPAAECIPSGFVSKLDEYKRGTMTSTAVTSHTLKKLQGLMPPLVIDHQISHYPSLSGAVRITSRIRATEDVVKELGQQIPPIETVVHSDGRYEGSWVMPDMSDRAILNGQGKITINGLKFNFAQAETFKASLNLGKLLADSPMGALALSGVSYEADMQDSPRCTVHLNNRATFKLADLSFDEKLKNAKFNYKNLNANVALTEKNDDLAMKIVAGFDNVEGGGGRSAFAVKNMAFDVTLDKMSKTGYLNMAKGMDTMPVMVNPQQMVAAMMRFIPDLVKNSPTLELNKLAFTFDMPEAKGSFSALGKASFDANGFDIGQIKTNPAALQARIHAEGQGEASKSLFASLPGSAQSELQAFIAQGLINEEGDLYKAKASFDKGEILINGKPFTPPGKAAARPSADVTPQADADDVSPAPAPVAKAPVKRPAPAPAPSAQRAKPVIPNIFGRH